MTARIAGFVTRADAGLRSPRSVSYRIWPERDGVAFHWGGPAQRLRSHAACIQRWNEWQRYHRNTRGWTDIAYCVDAETEILTDHGWVNYEHLNVDDHVLTLNHESGLAEWQPVLEVCVFPALPREMVSMESDRHSSLTTPDHRWPVERAHERTGLPQHPGPDDTLRNADLPHSIRGYDRKWVTSETFGYWDKVPIAADLADLPTTPKHDDAWVELVAWFWTEGHIIRRSDGSSSRSVSITQSWQASPEGCDRIRSALRRTFGPPVEKMPRRGNSTDGVPRWRECRNGHKQEFYLNVDAGELVQRAAPGRVPTHDFLLSLTRAQLELFIETSWLADNSGPRTLAQKNRAAAEAFQFACTLAGYGTSLREKPPTTSTPYSMWEARIRKQHHFAPYRLSRGLRVIHDGPVWCPRTPNQTWLARRRGTVYFTGNTGGFCDHGYAFAGRGAGVRTAANGTNQANDEFYAVVWLGGEGETPTREALDAAEWWVRELRLHGGAATGVRPHSAFKPTGCPGGVLRGHAGRLNHLPTTGAAAVPDEEEAMTVPTGWIGRGRDRDPVALVFSDGHKIEVERSDTDAAARALGEVFGVPFDEDEAAMAPEEAYDEIPPVT